MSSVTGTGAAGTTTNVTVRDGSLNVTLALLNQYASQYAVKRVSLYAGRRPPLPTQGTLFQLAARHY
jgi:hypothetical protein